jgi:flagellar hook-associated protein 2
MANAVLGLGTGQASSLNQTLLDKLKAADTKATVTPIETSLTDLDTESVKIANIKLQVQDVLTAIKPLDLYVSGGVNAFDQKSATTSGDSVTFDAVDPGSLNTGTTNVTVNQLAQRDVYQTSTFSDSSAVVSSTAGSKIVINGVEFSTFNKTYSALADEININSKLNASVESVDSTSFRLVIKSENSGTDNALNIQESGVDLGLNGFTSTATITSGTVPNAGLTLTLNGTSFTTNGTENYSQFVSRINSDVSFNASIDSTGKVLIKKSDGTALDVTNDDLNLGLSNNNHTLTAQNLLAKIDGVDYNVSSNGITVDGGLKISAVKLGDSSISIVKDKTQISTVFKNFVDKYNTLIKSIDTELYSSDSKIKDKSTLRTIESQIKDDIFKDYGTNSNLNLFNYGLTVDKTGTLSVDDAKFNTAVSNDFDNLKDLFIGTAEKEGFGTQLKTLVDSMDGYNGIISTYEDNMATRKTTLTDQLTKEKASLDSKYAQLSQQFADYGTIINKFNAQFAGLKMMIGQATSSSSG